jgi:SPP1 family holin
MGGDLMDKGTLVRTILFALTWINTLLVSKGYTALPVISETEVALVLTLIVSVWAWFKNSYITKKGREQKAVLKDKNLL